MGSGQSTPEANDAEGPAAAAPKDEPGRPEQPRDNPAPKREEADVENQTDDEIRSDVVGAKGWVSPATGLTAAQVEESRERYGINEIPVHITPTYVLFLRQFLGFLPILIEIAAIISIAAGDYVDFIIIIAILLVNACLGFHEEYKAKKALDELANSIESEITVVRDGDAKVVSVSELVPGDVILLVGGVVVPADVKWLKGDTMGIDTAALTGEPLPRKYPSPEYGEIVLSGCTVKTGECYAQVVATGTNTEIGQAQADILQDKSVRVVPVFQKKIMVVIKILVCASFAFVVAVVLVLGLVYTEHQGFGDNTRDTILSGLAILISSIPIALPLVIQVNLALGAAHLAKDHAAIVTSIPALQDIASMSILCSDKTGTLTTANMSIIPEKIFTVNDFTPAQLLMFAFLTSNADKKDDPIDKAVVSAFENNEDAKALRDTAGYKQETLIGFNPEVKRVVSFVSTADGMITIAKGLPAKIMDTAAGSVDDHEIQWKINKINDKAFIQDIKEHDTEMSKAGYKTIAIAMCKGDAREEGDHVWEFVGLLPMLDPPRTDTAQTVESLHRAFISVKMITGDHVNVGKETARLIGLGTDIQAGEDIRNARSEEAKNELIWNADGFASVLPSDKRDVVLTLREKFGIVTGMTGDGVNDAPALSAAQVGIAVEGATDAAKNAADLILTEPGLSPIYGAVIASRRIFSRIKAYVIYRVAASGILVLVLSLMIFITGCAVDSLLVIILALLNDISMIPVAYDNAAATAAPEIPNTMKLVLQSLFFGLVNSGLSLGFLFAMEASDKLKQDISFNSNCNANARGFIWLHLVFMTELMIFSTRAPNFIFQPSYPSIWLIASVLLTCLLGVLIAYFSESDVDGENIGWIILFNFVSLFFVDALKVWFKDLIGEAAGDVIESEELVDMDGEPQSKSEIQKHLEKQKRYKVHKKATMSQADSDYSVELVDNKVTCRSIFCSPFNEMGITDNFLFGTRKYQAAAEASGAGSAAFRSGSVRTTTS